MKHLKVMRFIGESMKKTFSYTINGNVIASNFQEMIQVYLLSSLQALKESFFIYF